MRKCENVVIVTNYYQTVGRWYLGIHRYQINIVDSYETKQISMLLRFIQSLRKPLRKSLDESNVLYYIMYMSIEISQCNLDQMHFCT